MFILDKLEDPKRPLLGPNVKALKFWGILLPKNVFKKYFYLLLNFLVVVFIATEFVDFWFVKNDLNLLLYNLKISLVATTSGVKIVTFIFWQKHWKDIIDYVTRTDLAQRATGDVTQNLLITKFTRYCRKITMLYWSLMNATCMFLVFQPVFMYLLSQNYRESTKNGTEEYLQVINSWVPFDKNTILGHIAASAWQSYAAIYGSGWVASYDSNAIVIMVFFRAELELLKIDCADIFGTEAQPVSDDEVLRRFEDCHRRHVELIKYSHLFDSCLSPIMLLYMIMCSINLCVTAFQITSSQTSIVEKFITAEFLIFGVIQLFIYCWHSNEVYFASLQLSDGPYESNWWCRDVSHRKNLFILTAQMKKVVVFTAGPFTNLTVSTFISILKGAYSYYTILSKSQAK